MAASWIAMLSRFHVYLPTSIYGVSAILFAAMALALPETKDQKMPDTVEDGERMRLLTPREMIMGPKT